MITENIQQLNIDSRELGFIEDFAQESIFSAMPIRTGGNNKVFHIKTDSGKSFILKKYFWSAHDQRDRLNSEYSFLNYVWQLGLRCQPRPLACDKEQRLGLYSFIDGEQFATVNLKKEHILQAMDFLRNINASRNFDSFDLPRASDSCFTVAEHIQCIEKRIDRLQKISPASELEKELCSFIRDDICHAWKSVKESIVAAFANKLDSMVIACLSPSDFGFHNSIKANNGIVYFIDFEYAGIDDPVKLICDFFCQPKVPVPLTYFNDFSENMANCTGDNDIPRRASKLLLAYRLKWCMIMLNEFMRSEEERRVFAKGVDVVNDDYKIRQLDLARKYFNEFFG